MKFTKSIFLVAALTVLACLDASAQRAGLYTILAGGTTTLPVGTTNQFVTSSGTNQYGSPVSTSMTSSNLTQAIGEFDNVGFTFKATGVASSTNNIFGVRIFRSYDNGATFETYPYTVWTTNIAAPNGASTFTVATNLNNLTGVTHLGFSVENGCQNGGYLTNVYMTVYLKSPKFQWKQATQ